MVQQLQQQQQMQQAFGGRMGFQPMMVMMMPAGGFPPPLMPPVPPPHMMQQQAQQQPLRTMPQQPVYAQQQQQQPQQALQQPLQQQQQQQPAPAPPMPNQPGSPASHPTTQQQQLQVVTDSAVSPDGVQLLRSPSALSSFPPAVRISAFPVSPAHTRGGVDADALKTVPSRATLSQLEWARARRHNRDETMMTLWILAALLMLTLAFHCHRFSYDKALWDPFASAALALALVGALLLLLPIGLIFLGRSVQESAPAVVLMHSFWAWTGSFLLYIPLLVEHGSLSPSSAATALWLGLTSVPSSAALLAALILHAVSMAFFYPLVVRVVAGSPARHGSGVAQAEHHLAAMQVESSPAERRELHRALSMLSEMERQRSEHERALSATRRDLILAATKMKEQNKAHAFALAQEQNKYKQVLDEKTQLEAILDAQRHGKEMPLQGAARSLAAADRPGVSAVSSSAAPAVVASTATVDGADARALVLQLRLELVECQSLLSSERERSRGLESECASLRAQLVQLKRADSVVAAAAQGGSVNEQQQRVALQALQSQVEELTAKHADAVRALEQSQAQMRARSLVRVRTGVAAPTDVPCANCTALEAQLDHVRGVASTASSLQSQNASLRASVGSLRGQLTAALRRQAAVDARTQRKVDSIHNDLEEFDAFVTQLEPAFDVHYAKKEDEQ
jgi:hypothetical protein